MCTEPLGSKPQENIIRKEKQQLEKKAIFVFENQLEMPFEF